LAETTPDGARRASILRLTLDGLEADLDDLRDELIDALESFEGELRDATETLPDWLAVEPAALRELFQLPADGERPASVLGPRTVALAAAGVEQFVQDWLSDPADTLSTDEAAAYESDFTSRHAVIDRYETFSRHTASDAGKTLADWLDGILTELEDTRERDEAALRQLVSEGAIGKGRDARAEIAQLWEEQRARAAEVKEQWARLERLTFRGLELTIEGLAELRDFLERADAGVRGAYDALEEYSEPAADAEDSVIDEPGGGTLAGLQHERADDAIDTARRETIEIDRDAGIDEASNTFLRVAPAGSSSDGPDEPDEPDEPAASQDVDESYESATDDAIDEVGDTLVDDIGATAPIEQNELDALHDAAEAAAEVETVEMDRAPHDDELLDEDSAPGNDDEAEDAPTTTEDDGREVVYDGASDMADTDTDTTDAEPDSHDVTETAEDVVDDDPEDGVVQDEPRQGSPVRDTDREPVMAEAFRILDDWARVRAVEVVVVLGPPILAFATLVVMTASARAGGGADPIRDTPWGLIVFAGAVVWMFLAPVIAHWHYRFDGILPRFVRRAEIVEQADVEIDHAGIRIGELGLPWRGTSIETGRWESAPDHTFGWYVALERGPRRIVLAAAERNFSAWERSELPIDDDIDHAAWQVDARIVQAVEDFAYDDAHVDAA
jgi:hypothetical protein